VNVKDIIQSAAVDIGIPVPAAPFAATDVQTRQLVALLNKEGRELRKRHQWQVLLREYAFVTVATESQGSLGTILPLMQDILPETFWNRTKQEPLSGPLSPQEWQALKADNAAAPYNQWRLRGNELLMMPVPAAGHNCAFEYRSKAWLTDSTGAIYRNAIGADTDEVLLDDEVMLAGLIWRWKKAKGFEYGEDFNVYERQVQDLIAKDGGSRRISVTGGGLDGRGKATIPRMIGS
jgi:hypothetical protein